MKHIKNANSNGNGNTNRLAKTTDNFFGSNFLTQKILGNYSNYSLTKTQVSTETNPSHYKGKIARMEVDLFLNFP